MEDDTTAQNADRKPVKSVGLDTERVISSMKTIDRSSIHPVQVQQQQVAELLNPQHADMMSDLTMDEIRTIAIYRALSSRLGGELSGITNLFDDYIKLKLSYDRLSRKELVSILRPSAKYYVSGSSTRDPENKPEQAATGTDGKKKRFIFF